MNFAIFDEDFELDKPNYIEEISALEKNLISEGYINQWQDFVKKHLTDTRNYFLLKTALKIMQNLKKQEDFDTAVFSSLSFMPDQGFIHTAIMLVVRFSDIGQELAKHFNVDVADIIEAKKAEKNDLEQAKKLAEKKANVNQIKKEEEVVFGVIPEERKLFSSKSIGAVSGQILEENLKIKKQKK